MKAIHNSFNSENTKIKMDSIEDALLDIKKGKLVIVVDDEDRENEGDFITAAETVTPELINFMATHGRGLICTPILESRAKDLNLDLMVKDNTALHETAFTVSIDYLKKGCTTGISAYDRATGIKAITSKDVQGSDYARPGHIFPLIAKKGGVLRRTGHTEAAVDLARMAGFFPAGVLVEILNEDGSMARLPQLSQLSKKLNIKLISIKDLVAYRMKTERIIELVYETKIEHNEHGIFNIRAYKQKDTNDIHLAIYMGDFDENQSTLVRVHSDTKSGDILGFLFDDFGQILDNTLAKIAKAKRGVLLYMRQAEKSNEIINKLKTFDQDLSNANSSPMEQRDYGIGAQILRDLNVGKITLLSDTNKKRIGLIGYGLEIVDTIPTI